MSSRTIDDPKKRERDAEFQREALCWLPQVTRYALSLTRNEADADDLVQETFLRAYRSWDTYTLGTECRGWLFTICRNTFRRNRERARCEVSSDDPELEALAAAAVHAAAVEGGHGELFVNVDLSEAIDRALGELPEAFRDAVILVDVQDQSYETASVVLGVPIGTVRSRLFRGRRLLQASLLAYARDAGFTRTADGTGDGERT
jgi:RNA polymerase sigma-70 factor (ECF subfamily)